ncbi:DASH complex subunit Dad1 [Aspergillus sp. HF37]|nr:DASH complex subunit Dad1 [Aspergillus sp. HF37]
MSTPGSGTRATSPTVFEQQREELVREIAVGMEGVLQNINRLNRNLESIITVGNEFGSVEALWSQFENFMGRPEGENGDGKQNEGHDGSNEGGNKREDDTTVVQER